MDETKRDEEEKLVFLDVDGVIRPFYMKDNEDCIKPPRSVNKFSKASLKAFARILEETGAKIILSSTWRLNPWQKKQLLEVFKMYGAPLDKIENFEEQTRKCSHNVRKWEVAEWIVEQREKGRKVKCWVALDDDKSFTTGDKYKEVVEGHYVMTHPMTGLTEDNADRAIEILNKE